MDAVKSFNAELSALYDVKPPISKAKMTALTRGAIKAIKFYKHVVQSVEKFILKCKPEYKIPGLYVIDSIVRQSRHQFGADKDVFAPRFAKNMQQTFVNLFRCPPEDKSKIIRVLNLWQKNQVFAPDVIQPLFDLADPNHPIHREQLTAQNNGLSAQAVLNNLAKVSPGLQKSPAKMLQHQGDVANTLQHLGMAGLASNPNMLLGLQSQTLDPNMLAQLQTLHRLLLKQGDSSAKQEGVHFDRKLLDFDYGSEDEEDPKQSPNKMNSNMDPTLGNLLSNPEVLRQLQTLQQQLQQSQQSQQMEMEEKIRKLQEMKQQEEEFDKHLAQTVANLPFAAECDLKPTTNSPAIWTKQETSYLLGGVDITQPPPGYKPYDQQQGMDEGNMGSEVEFVDNGDVEVINLDNADSQSRSSHDDRYSSRRRGRSRSRDRSRDRGRDRRSRRSRSRSRSRRRRSRSREKEREKEREEREKERERRKRGLPPLKKDNLSVCSTTLWVGHLSKLVHQEDLSDTFGEFGDIVSIDLIPPRGCAFIVMHRRQDAARCLQKLKSHKMQGKAITLAWAPGKGVKGKDLKDYWDIELGVSYIPWNKIRQDIDLELLEDGGMIDEDTMPQWMKAKMALTQSKPSIIKASDADAATAATVAAAAPAAAAAALMTLGGETVAAASAAVDTSQPPPLHGVPVGAPGLLAPPPMAMPLVPPFPINPRLLGPMGMGMPPGLMPNVPIGVPPPNALMGANLGLGIGSPFGQGMLTTQQLQSAAQMPPVPPGNPSDKDSDNAFGQALLPTPHDENMDVEMEDAAEKSDKPPPLSEQLLASIGQQYNGNGPRANHRDIDDRPGRDSRDRGRDRDRDSRGRGGGGGSGSGGERDRDRGGRRNSRERNRDGRDSRRDDRDNNRRDRENRGNRWSDRRDDRRGAERNDRDEKRPERSDKTVNDRLREMANEGVYNSRHRDGRSDGPRFEPPEVPPLLDRPVFPPQFGGPNDLPPMGPPDLVGPPDRPDLIIGPPDLDRDDRFHRGDFDPVNNFDMRMRRHPGGPPMGPPGMGPPPDFCPPDRFDDGPEFDGPPLDYPDRIMDGGPPDRFDFRRGGDGPPPFDDMRMMDDFDPRMRGGPDFFPPHRDGGFRPPMMRGPGPDMFPPRGPPGMMGRPPGPHMFHPRGMRGPRPGPWMEGGGMRPPNFGPPHPRFDGPPDGGPPFFKRSFDEPHPGGPPGGGRHDRRRHDDRRGSRYRPDDNMDDVPPGPQPPQQPPAPHSGGRDRGSDRRSRWGNASPPRQQEDSQPSASGTGGSNDNEPLQHHHQSQGSSASECVGGDEGQSSMDDSAPAECTTPLRDEPPMCEMEPAPPQENVSYQEEQPQSSFEEEYHPPPASSGPPPDDGADDGGSPAPAEGGGGGDDDGGDAAEN